MVLHTTTTPAELLQRSKTIAVVGFSTDPSKPSHTAPMELVRRGWNVIPIHPTATEVAGIPAYKSLADVPVKIDLVDVFRPSAEALDIVKGAAMLGIPAVWLQLGITSDAAREYAVEHGMEYVEDTCAGALARSRDLYPTPNEV